MRRFFTKLRWSFRRRDKEAELREELQFHLAEDAAEGKRELGNVTLIAEETRAAWGWTWIEQLGQDLRYAFRTMKQNRAFTALAVLSLALGIGANAAIYSFMDAILVRSLPVSNPETLAVLNWHMRGKTRGSIMHGGSGSIFDENGGSTSGNFPYPAFELLRKSEGAFSYVFAHFPTRDVNVMVDGQAEIASGEFVSGDYFAGLEVSPLAGRSITNDDDQPGAPPVAILSYGYAQRRFASAQDAQGKTVRMNGVPFTVIGVAPPEFFGVDPGKSNDFYVPVHSQRLLGTDHGGVDRQYIAPNFFWIEIMARLRPGVSLQQAQAMLGPQFHQWALSIVTTDKERANLPELRVKEGAGGLDSLRRQYSKPLYVLLAMVILILAIACANIANLLLARATSRRREMAVRLSMGAGRMRVIRQLLTESVLLASIGGAAGILLAIWGVRFLTVLLDDSQEHLSLHASLNWHVLVAAVALSILTGLLFGLAPAFQATRVDVMPVLKETPAAGRRPRFRRLQIGLSQTLVVSQIALSLLMLVAAGLFVRTLANLQSIALGFRPENILLFDINARQPGHRDPEIADFHVALQERLARIHGVRGATFSIQPIIGRGTWMFDVSPIGKPSIGTTHIMAAGTGYFETMLIPIAAGRAFDEHDQPGSPMVAVVNEAWVKANLPDGENPLGQRIHFTEPPPRLKQREMTIAGVAKNARYGELKGDFAPTVFIPLSQGWFYPFEEIIFALRTSGDPLAHAAEIREIVHEADPRVPVTNLRTQASQVAQTMRQEIVFARLCTGFAILALVIACVGLYGTMSYTVARRTSEIGIRMALGAQRGRVIGMIMGQVIVMAAVGLVIGVPAARGLSKFVGSFLYGIKPNDPVTSVAAAATLVFAAIVAGYAPAWRASRIDPMAALRHE